MRNTARDLEAAFTIAQPSPRSEKQLRDSACVRGVHVIGTTWPLQANWRRDASGLKKTFDVRPDASLLTPFREGHGCAMVVIGATTSAVG